MKRIVSAFCNSYKGLKAVWRDECAFRQEIFLALILIPLAFYLDVTTLERTLLIATMLLVLLVEIINSAIEAVVDLVSPEIHPLAGKAKDAGSLAVLVAFFILALTWGAILLT